MLPPSAPIVTLFQLLAEAIGSQGLKPTAASNLPQRFLREAGLAYWSEEGYKKQTEFGDIRTEPDFYDIHATRIVAELAGLVRKYKGKFILSRECRHEPIAQAEPAKPEMPIQQVETDQPHVLPDYLGDGFDIVFVGTAASDLSAARKHYYSGYNNAFYKCIFQAGIVPVPLGLEDDWRLPEYGVGLTDMVKNSHAGDDSNLSRSELSGGAPSLKKKIIAFSPKIVCFNGKTAYAAFSGRRHHHYGLAGIGIGSSKVFVVPSTSGRVNADVLLNGKTRLQWFQVLAQLRDVEKLGGSCV